MLLGHARHDGPQQRELVRCVLAVRRERAVNIRAGIPIVLSHKVTKHRKELNFLAQDTVM